MHTTTDRRRRPVRLVALTAVMALAVAACNVKPNDYDGDKKADIVYIAGGTTGGAWVQDGAATPLWSGMRSDYTVGGDYDNDGKWEPAELVGRDWYSSKLAAPIHYDPVGLPTADPDWPHSDSVLSPATPKILPVPADYDGDGDTDPAYYALVDGSWWIRGRDGFTRYGTPPTHIGGLDWDVPVPADYDGDKKADLAVFHPRDHSFHILLSQTGTERIVKFPSNTAVMPVPADFTGDNVTDPAVSDTAGLTWWLTPDTPTPTYTFPHASTASAADTYPVPADYDGDKKADPANYGYSGSRAVHVRIGGSDTLLTTLPSNAGPMPALPFARLVNIVRLTFYGQCLSGRYHTSATAPIPKWQVCPPAPIPFDLDGDEKADIAWTSATGAWNRLGESGPFFTSPVNGPAVAGDYDNDGRWEPAGIDDSGAVPQWVTPTRSIPFALPSYTLAHYPDWYGGASVGSPILPVPARYDWFETQTRPAYYVIATGQWLAQGMGPPITFGTTPTPDGDLGWDVPVPGDYNGRIQDAYAVYRPSDSTFRSWLTGQVIQVGRPGDRPAAADYDGDGVTDAATYRPATGEWFIAGQPARALAPAIDTPSDWVPIPADYDGDGRADLALFNLVDGRWVIDGRGLVTTLGSGQTPIEYPRAIAASMPRLVAYDHCLHDPTWATLYPGHCAGTP